MRVKKSQTKELLKEQPLVVFVFQYLVIKKWYVLLFICVWVTALSVAMVTHKVRQETIALEALKQKQHQFEMEWETLRLEQGALAEHYRIERLARKNLDMKVVSARDEKLVENQ